MRAARHAVRLCAGRRTVDGGAGDCRQFQFIFVSQSEMYLANRGEEYYVPVGPTPMRVIADEKERIWAGNACRLFRLPSRNDR